MTVRVSAFGIITLLGRTQPENRIAAEVIRQSDFRIHSSARRCQFGDRSVPTRPAPCHTHRGENPCTRRYCSCHPLWAGTSPPLLERSRPPAAVSAPQRPPPVATPEAAIASDCSTASALATPQRDRGAAAAASPPLTAVPLQRLRFLPQCPSLPPVAAAARPSPLRAAILAPPAVATAAIGSTIAGRTIAAPPTLAPLRVPRPASRRW